MALFNWGKKKPRDTDTLALMKYYIITAENDIKKIEKERSKLADARFRNPSWNRRVEGELEYISDTEAGSFNRRRKEVKKRLIGELAPLMEQLQKEIDFKSYP